MEKRVLLVDADPAFAEGVARDLSRAGINVSVVADDGTAVERARAERPDAILLSEVAERNVFASCNRVRRTPGLAEIPVVVLSESATPSAIEAHRASRTPASLYLRRSLDAPSLARALRPLLGDGQEDEEANGITRSLGVEEIGEGDVIEDVVPIDDEEDAAPPAVGRPPPLELPPDPLAESAPESRAVMGSSPEERVQFLRDRLRARDELVQRARVAWSARDRDFTSLHGHATRLFGALQAQQAALAERDETVSELERSVLVARREHEQLRQAEAQLREQLDDAEGRARSLSEILNDTLQQREEGDRGWSARLAEVEAAAGELKTELDGLRSAREQLDEALERAASELREARDELDAAASREAALQEDLEVLRSSSAVVQEQLESELRSERERLDGELIQVRGDLENEVAAVRGDLSARIAELSGELSATRDEAGDRSLELEEARGQLDDLSARLEDASRRADELERHAAQRATRIESLEVETDSTRTELLAARSRIEARERELADMRTSADARAASIEADLEERLAAAGRELESAVAAERADAEARIAEVERIAAESRAQREQEIEAELADAAARLEEVRAATRADMEARMAQVSSSAAARVHALEQELERREARFEDQLAVARGEAQVLAAEASGDAEERIAAIDARLADMARRHEEQFAAVRAESVERERELEQLASDRERAVRAEMERRLAQAREEADEAIAHARSEIEEHLAGAETDADDRIAALERTLHEERAAHERELGGREGVEPSADAAELGAARDQIQALEAQVKAAVEQAARFRSDRDRAAGAYEKAREEAVRLRRQQPGGAELEQLRREVREVRASRERLQDELASQIADLVSKLSRRETELAAARRSGDAAATPDLQAALHKVELLERERSRLLAEREGLEDGFRRQLEQITSAGDAAVIHALRSRVAELQDQLQGGASRGRLEQLEAELEELRGENEFLSSEVARYAEKVAALAGKGPTPIARIKR